jgi:hypothetical protein
MIHQCTCKHDYQDRLYGKGNRLFNPCKPKEKAIWGRCTVCGNTLQLGKVEEKKDGENV